MAPYVPFVMNAGDARLVTRFYKDAEVCRVALRNVARVLPELPKARLWIDPEMDGYDHIIRGRDAKSIDDGWDEYVRSHRDWDVLSVLQPINPEYRQRVAALLDDVLGRCMEARPTWLTIPQLPLNRSDAPARNRANQVLAKAVGAWRKKTSPRVKLVLPVIFTHYDQYRSLPARRKGTKAAIDRINESGADGAWVVDSSLADFRGVGTFERERFPALLNFHELLCEGMVARRMRLRLVAGPYWGLNLLLWAKGWASHVGLTVGRSFRYYVSGGHLSAGKTLVAIPPLRRFAAAAPELAGWLKGALRRIPKSDPARRELEELADQFHRLQISDRAKVQVAKFYADWLHRIDGVAAPGRPVALYQDLSAAYVLGNTLKGHQFPKQTGLPRGPEVVARQLMLNCF
jgi:hypothetical protein